MSSGHHKKPRAHKDPSDTASCRFWCQDHVSLWQTKCSWRGCGGCGTCKGTVLEQHNADQAVKGRYLSYLQNTTTANVSLLLRTKDQAAEGSFACNAWCPGHLTAWKTKCGWSLCGACAQCSLSKKELMTEDLQNKERYLKFLLRKQSFEEFPHAPSKNHLFDAAKQGAEAWAGELVFAASVETDSANLMKKEKKNSTLEKKADILSVEQILALEKMSSYRDLQKFCMEHKSSASVNCAGKRATMISQLVAPSIEGMKYADMVKLANARNLSHSHMNSSALRALLLNFGVDAVPVDAAKSANEVAKSAKEAAKTATATKDTKATKVPVDSKATKDATATKDTKDTKDAKATIDAKATKAVKATENAVETGVDAAKHAFKDAAKDATKAAKATKDAAKDIVKSVKGSGAKDAAKKSDDDAAKQARDTARKTSKDTESAKDAGKDAKDTKRAKDAGKDAEDIAKAVRGSDDTDAAKKSRNHDGNHASKQAEDTARKASKDTKSAKEANDDGKGAKHAFKDAGKDATKAVKASKDAVETGVKAVKHAFKDAGKDAKDTKSAKDTKNAKDAKDTDTKNTHHHHHQEDANDTDTKTTHHHQHHGHEDPHKVVEPALELAAAPWCGDDGPNGSGSPCRQRSDNTAKKAKVVNAMRQRMSPQAELDLEATWCGDDGPNGTGSPCKKSSNPGI